MAAEERKDPKREKAKSLYDNPRSRKDDAAEEKSEPAAEKKAEETAGEEEKADSEPASAAKPEAKAEEGGEPVREPGEAKAKPAGNPMIGGHKAQRVALHLRHEKERLDLHGDQRTEHKVMTDAHEKEMVEVHRA